jgi:hypothetical protein
MRNDFLAAVLVVSVIGLALIVATGIAAMTDNFKLGTLFSAGTAVSFALVTRLVLGFTSKTANTISVHVTDAKESLEVNDTLAAYTSLESAIKAVKELE